MTVKELIEKLQSMPQDAIVIYRAWSDWNDLEPDEIGLFSGEKEFRTLSHSHPVTQPDGKVKYEVVETTEEYGLIRHNGHLMEIKDTWWPRNQGDRPINPQFLKAVTFPGN